MIQRAVLLGGIAAFALSACAGGSSLPSAGPLPVTSSAISVDVTKTKIVVSPKAFNFSTSPTMKVTISESKYHGKFTLSVTPTNLVKISNKKPKGPKAKVTLTALNAGKGTLTIVDSSKRKKKVPVSVTQGVIIIQ